MQARDPSKLLCGREARYILGAVHHKPDRPKNDDQDCFVCMSTPDSSTRADVQPGVLLPGVLTSGVKQGHRMQNAIKCVVASNASISLHYILEGKMRGKV